MGAPLSGIYDWLFEAAKAQQRFSWPGHFSDLLALTGISRAG
jgi:hypothetical protein